MVVFATTDDMDVGLNVGLSIDVQFINASRDANKWWTEYGKTFDRAAYKEKMAQSAANREKRLEEFYKKSKLLGDGSYKQSDYVIDEDALPYKSYSQEYADMSLREYLDKEHELFRISPFGLEKPAWFTEMSRQEQDAFIYTYDAIREDFQSLGTLITHDSYRVGALYGMALAKIDFYEQTVEAENGDRLREYADFYLSQAILEYGGRFRRLDDLDKNGSFFKNVTERFRSLGNITNPSVFHSSLNNMLIGLEDDASNLFYKRLPNAPTDPNFRWKVGAGYTSPIGVIYVSANEPIVNNWNNFINKLSSTLSNNQLKSYVHYTFNTTA